MGYRLTAIEVAGFRGFNAPTSISLADTLVILYAPNGHGKSSVCEAIEWAIYGSTSRRARGEAAIQRREFDNSLRNRLYPIDRDAYVSLVLSDGSRTVEVRRVVTPDEGMGKLFVDGSQAENLEALGIPSEPQYALILQHAIRDFIFAKPADRFSLVSAQLGMGAFTRFQNALQNASRAFKTKPSDVVDATALVSEAIQRAASHPALGPLVQVLRKEDVTAEEIRRAVASTFESLYGGPPPSNEDLPAAIASEVQRLVARAFDATKLGIDHDVNAAFDSTARQLRALAEDSANRRHELARELTSVAAEQDGELVELAKRSLAVIDPKSAVCPVCGQQLSPDHVETIRRRSTKIIVRLDIGHYFSQAILSVRSASQTALLLRPPLLGQDDRERLTTILGESTGKELLTVCDRAVAAVDDAFRDFGESVQGLDARLGSLGSKALVTGEPFKDLALLAVDLVTVQQHLSRIKAAREALMKTYARLRDSVRGRVATSSEVAQLEALSVILQRAEAFDLVARYRSVERQVEETVRLVQAFGRRKRTEVLDARSAELGEWYSILNPASDVKFKKMGASATQISLLGEVFGVEVNVSSIFSEAQLNCLGLSFHGLTTQAPDNPFDFVVIDDPVQSMDQQHIEHFTDGYLRRLVEGGKQVVLLTHMQALAMSVGILFRHVGPYLLEVAQYTRDGPQIVETEAILDRWLMDIGFYLRGDSERRRQAGAILRKFLERFVKELYLQRHGVLPKKYEGASWNVLKKLVHDCGLDLKDEGRLFQTYAFCANFPHDDLTKEPPTPTEIESHHMRLKRLKEQYLRKKHQ
ncbi:MAG: AAA family ATPase [Chloroflexi bacterium]|nr:AAA family ATPase [Chloroflexota bacterium]